MTCLSSLSDNLTPLVPDTSVLINLHACSFGEQVLRAIPNDIILPDRVVAELNHETSHTNGENGFIQRLISEQVVKVVQLNDAAYCNFETLIRSPGSLDDGEAATIAVAAAMGFVPVVDERKGRDVTPVFHPPATRDRPVLSRMSAGEATGGVNPARCCSSPAANAAGVA